VEISSLQQDRQRAEVEAIGDNVSVGQLGYGAPVALWEFPPTL